MDATTITVIIMTTYFLSLGIIIRFIKDDIDKKLDEILHELKCNIITSIPEDHGSFTEEELIDINDPTPKRIPAKFKHK